MKLNVYGGSHRQKELATDMAHFAGKRIMSSRMYDSLEVNLHLRDKMQEREGVYGTCIWMDDNYRPKEFEINIDRGMKQRLLLESVAHEMVHVKQWATGQLYDYIDGDTSRYDGKKYSKSKMDYYDYPWEIEAYGREAGLFVRWAESRGFADAAWAQRTK